MIVIVCSAGGWLVLIMIKKVFAMQLMPGFETEYEQRHNPIPVELSSELRAHGVTSYSIFLDSRTNMLFAYMEFESEDKLSELAKTDACQRWWRYMAPLMEVNPDFSPVRIDLREVFELSASANFGNALPEQKNPSIARRADS